MFWTVKVFCSGHLAQILSRMCGTGNACSIKVLLNHIMTPFSAQATFARLSTIFGHTLYMCGRYRLSRRKQILAEQFAAVSDDVDWSPRYNIAPTQLVPVIMRNSRSARRELSLIRWGLALSWAKDSSKAAAMINARSETAASKPAFYDALKFPGV